MKNSIILLFLLVSVTAAAQYKHFTASTFGATNNFDSHHYYSSPGIGLQFNFKKVFSLFTGLSRERIKQEHSEFNDLQFYYSTSSHTMTYLNIPLAVKASFGRKVLFFVEAGVLFHWKHKAIVGGYSTKWGQPEDTTYYDYEYLPQQIRTILPYAGAGLIVPVYQDFSIQLNVRRSIYREEDYSNEDHFSFNNTQGFAGFTYNLGITYSFNIKKDSKYTFTTHYLHFIKNTSDGN